MKRDTLYREYQEKKLSDVTRRHFLRTCSTGMGALALAGLSGLAMGSPQSQPGVRRHYHAHAKRVIYLHMAGSPSQLELFELRLIVE